MVYPAVVLVVMIAVVLFMIIKVVPQVEMLYKSMSSSKTLPLITLILVQVAHGIMRFWYVILIVLGVAFFLTTKWARTGAGKEVIDHVKMRVWPIGPLFMKVYMARFARTGSTLVASGVPLLQVLGITSDAVNNVHIGRAIKRAADKVKGGKSLGDAIENDPNFLPIVSNMIKIGEQSGAIEQMMSKVADYYEKEVDTEVANISSIIEPVMMIALGIVAFIIVAAVLLPIYGLAGNIKMQ